MKKLLLLLFGAMLLVACSKDDTVTQDIDCWRCKVTKIRSSASGYNMNVCNTDRYLARFKAQKVKEGNTIKCYKLVD